MGDEVAPSLSPSAADEAPAMEGLVEAPCYYPTAAQFAEPLEYIASIRPEAERHGICRICPPRGWKAPFAHKPDKLRFATKEQDLGKLSGRQRLRRKFTENLRKFLFLIGKPMESAFGGKIFIGNRGRKGPVDMFRLFKEVQQVGGHESVSRAKGWPDLAASMGFPTLALGQAMKDAYMRYLADFEAVHSGKGLQWDGVAYTPVVYREKPSVEADIRVGTSLWHFMEEDSSAGRCYFGSVKSLRAGGNCMVEYDRAERFPPQKSHSHHRMKANSIDSQQKRGRNGGLTGSSREEGLRGSNENCSCNEERSGNGGERGSGWSDTGGRSNEEGSNGEEDGGAGWSGCKASAFEEVEEPFRVTLPRSQLSTLVLNGKSPAAAKLAAHGVICEVCSIAAASKAVLAVCASCDSAYHLGCVEPSLPRVPFHDWFCGDCAKDGNTAEALARGSIGLFPVLSSPPSKHQQRSVTNIKNSPGSTPSPPPSSSSTAVKKIGKASDTTTATTMGTSAVAALAGTMTKYGCRDSLKKAPTEASNPGRKSNTAHVGVAADREGRASCAISSSSAPEEARSTQSTAAAAVGKYNVASEDGKKGIPSEKAVVKGERCNNKESSSSNSIGGGAEGNSGGPGKETEGCFSSIISSATAGAGVEDTPATTASINESPSQNERVVVDAIAATTATTSPTAAGGGAAAALPAKPALFSAKQASTTNTVKDGGGRTNSCGSICSPVVKGEQSCSSSGRDEDEDGGESKSSRGSSGVVAGGGGRVGSGAGSASLAESRMRGGSTMKGRALKYGFGNGGVFTLKEYALMADSWRSSYLARRGLGDEATEAEMEAEFWKLVGPDPPEDDVKVLYGSDLDTGVVGSGFPWGRGEKTAAPEKPATEADQGTAKRLKRSEGYRPLARGWEAVKDPDSYEDHSYEEDAWNLNCLPTSDGSLLQFLGTQIQGVMVPWLYVGMAFSAFCWHNEDHYLYSINYLHAGSPKRWYGVPGSMAGLFEEAVQEMFPELFEAHPDLLMQLVTMAHPSELASRGVPVSSTTQREGEFVLTFPQAYHAGFNMGTNCAEAVNFAPPDWLPWGNAAQERYRVHKRKPVFSHEGLVLSLVDLLSKQASDGRHASGELYRFLRDELKALAVAQEEKKTEAERLGCMRFEPMEKLVERLRGWSKASLLTEGASAVLASRRSSSDSTNSSSSSSSSGSSNGCSSASTAAITEGEAVFRGLESGSAVQGPQCAVCDQYCFLAAAICDNCDGGATGRAPVRASSSNSSAGIPVGGGGGDAGAAAAAAARRRHSKRRFACGRHLAELCSCRASEYTYYQRRDAAQLRVAAESLTSVEEHLETWGEDARKALAAARGAGGGSASSFRPAKGSSSGGANGGGEAETAEEPPVDGAVKVELPPPASSDAPTPPPNSCAKSPEIVSAAAANEKAQPTTASAAGDINDAKSEASEEEPDAAVAVGSVVPVNEQPEEEAPQSRLPAGWHERPSLRYIGNLIRVGEELNAQKNVLNDLRQVVDACAGWVKTIEMILGPSKSDSAAAATAAAISFGTAKRSVSLSASVSGSTDGGVESGIPGRGRLAGGRGGRGANARDGGLRNGTRSESTVKRREQVPFHKAINLLSTEAKLPGRPAETTERLCAAIMRACYLRMQVRSLLGLGEDEYILAAKAMCMAMHEAGMTATPVEFSSGSVTPPSSSKNGTGKVEEVSLESKYGAAIGGPTTAAIGEHHSMSGSGGGGARGISPTHRGPATTGGLASAFSALPFSDANVFSDISQPRAPACDIKALPRQGSARTRTRTNVSLPTGTLAAERGTWKLQPWRLWPVHQAAAAALVEPCLFSAVAVPEAPLLRKALTALAERADKSLVMVDSGLAMAETTSGCGKRGRDRDGSSGAGGSGTGGSGTGGSGGNLRGRRSASGRGGGGGGGGGDDNNCGGGGKSSKFSSCASSPPGSSAKGVSIGGGVLIGVPHKRRRQDAVAVNTPLQ